MGWPSGLRARFGTAMLSGGLGLAIAVYAIAGRYVDRVLHDELEGTARLFASVIAHQVDHASSTSEVERIVYVIGGNRNVRDAMCVLDDPPTVVGATQRLLVGKRGALAIDPLLARAHDAGGFHDVDQLDTTAAVYELVQPVHFANLNVPELGRRHGAVLVRIDASQLLARAGTTHRLLLGGTVGVVVAMIVLFMLLTQRQILWPIARLRAVMARRRDGDLVARPERMPNSDLQSIADSLVELIDAHDRMAAMQRAVVEGASDAIVTIDVRGTIRQWNGGAEEMFGIPAHEAIGSNVTRILPVEHRDRHDGYIRRYLDTGIARVLGFSREVQGVRADGSLFPIGLGISEARVGDERLFVGILRDMTDEVATRQELQKAKDAADAAATAKAAFLANMSHEIRTPLTAILGYAEELGDPELTPASRQEAVEVIQHNGEHLMTIVNDILDLSKIEAGRMATEKVECQAERIAADVLRLMLPRAQAKGLQLQLQCASPMPRAIASDPTRIRQILINLVGNAIKFTRSGSVTIEIAPDFAAETMRIAVVDSGVGIAPEALERLFGSFVQADSSTTRLHGGTGLGLHISRRLARMLGGDLQVTSEVGRGSTFTCTLATGPMQPAEAGAAAPETAPRRRAVAPRLRGRVLLAEDGLDNVRLLQRILAPTGIELTVVNNGADALAAVQRGTPRFDAVLMDMQMPVMDGLTASRAIRATGAAMPIVALTANVMPEDRARASAAGCTHFATKPIDRAALYAMLQATMPAAESPQGNDEPAAQRATSASNSSTSA